MTAGKAAGAADAMRDFLDATGSYGRLLEKSSRLATILQISNADGAEWFTGHGPARLISGRGLP
ncbi:MAG: hypothetical protein ACHQIO_11480 [Nevskiales bacterium]